MHLWITAYYNCCFDMHGHNARVCCVPQRSRCRSRHLWRSAYPDGRTDLLRTARSVFHCHFVEPHCADCCSRLFFYWSRYLFDLRGYSVLPNALPAEDMRAINDWIDGLDLERRPIGDWEGDVEIHSYCAGSSHLVFCVGYCSTSGKSLGRTGRRADAS